MALELQQFYQYCETCQEFFDMWKHDNIADTDHSGPECVRRAVTPEEFLNLLQSCQDDGCLSDNHFETVIDERQSNLIFIKNMIDLATYKQAKKVTA